MSSGLFKDLCARGTNAARPNPTGTDRQYHDGYLYEQTDTAGSEPAGFYRYDGVSFLWRLIARADVSGALDVDDISAPVFAQDAGANDTYTATLSPAPVAYTVGTHYRFKANSPNTGACTINFNGLGAKTIKKAAGGITTDLADNDIRAGQWVDLVYDGTNMQMQSMLGNAPGGGGGTPGGSSGDFQYNAAGAFAAAPLVREDADTVALYDTSNTSENPSRLNLYGLKNGSTFERLSLRYSTADDCYVLEMGTIPAGR